MYLDTNQCIGTLAGLKSKVVLRNDANNRLVLIPDGKVTWQKAKSHIEVKVEHASSRNVYPFELDALQGRLLDNGKLESKLALCYLHALTAFCLPDRFTGKTGTEQALEILNSAAVRSFTEFSEEHIAAIHNIAELTPRRVYYPSHLQVMQTVEWVQGLSPLSQHGLFFIDATRLLAEAASLDFFYSKENERRKGLDCGERFLIERDLVRSSVFRSSGSGAEQHTAKHDKIYDLLSQRHMADSSHGMADVASSGSESISSITTSKRLRRSVPAGVNHKVLLETLSSLRILIMDSPNKRIYVSRKGA